MCERLFQEFLHLARSSSLPTGASSGRGVSSGKRRENLTQCGKHASQIKRDSSYFARAAGTIAGRSDRRSYTQTLPTGTTTPFLYAGVLPLQKFASEPYICISVSLPYVVIKFSMTSIHYADASGGARVFHPLRELFARNPVKARRSSVSPASAKGLPAVRYISFHCCLRIARCSASAKLRLCNESSSFAPNRKRIDIRRARIKAHPRVVSIFASRLKTVSPSFCRFSPPLPLRRSHPSRAKKTGGAYRFSFVPWLFEQYALGNAGRVRNFLHRPFCTQSAQRLPSRVDNAFLSACLIRICMFRLRS